MSYLSKENTLYITFIYNQSVKICSILYNLYNNYNISAATVLILYL